MLDLVLLAITGQQISQNKEIMDNPIQELNSKVVELYGKLAKLEYDLDTLNLKKETMKGNYAKTVSAVNQDEGIIKG